MASRKVAEDRDGLQREHQAKGVFLRSHLGVRGPRTLHSNKETVWSVKYPMAGSCLNPQTRCYLFLWFKIMELEGSK